MSKIKYSNKALIDLIDIEKYIKEELESPVAAKNTITKITKKIRLLEEFPELGAPLSSIVDIENDYRYLVCENYLAFYRISETNVLIIRIIYGKRDYLKILLEDNQSNDTPQ